MINDRWGWKFCSRFVWVVKLLSFHHKFQSHHQTSYAWRAHPGLMRLFRPPVRIFRPPVTVCLGKCTYPDGDPIGKPRMIHQQTSNDSIVLNKDTGFILDLPIDSDQLRVVWFRSLEEGYQSHTRFSDWWWPMTSREKLNWPKTRCFLKTDKSWIDYRALSKILAYQPTLTGHAV